MASLINNLMKNAVVPAAGGLMALLLAVGFYRRRHGKKALQAEASLIERREPSMDALALDQTGIQPVNATQVGDGVRWESNGVVQFENRRVEWVSEDGLFARVEGSLTGLPVAQLSVAAPSDAAATAQWVAPSEVESPRLFDEVRDLEPVWVHPEPDPVREAVPAIESGREDRKASGVSPRHGALFAAGLLLGAAAAAWIVLGLPAAPVAPQLQQARTPVPAPKPEQVTAASQQRQGACLQEPATAAAGDKDRQLQLQADVSAKTSRDLARFIAAGKEAAAQGRPRDAEVALLMACRIADRLMGPASDQAAEARYQLGRHYASLAVADGVTEAQRTDVLKRAEVLFAASLQTFLGKYGDAHEMSRLAGDGLKGVWQTLANPQLPAAPALAAAPETSPPPEPERLAQAPIPEPAEEAPDPPKADQADAPKVGSAPARPAARAKSVPPRVAVAAPQPGRGVATARPPARQATGRPMQARPSFDCARARSPSEKLICSDPRLAQLDRDLGRLHARAKDSASDAAAFRRRNDQEWRRRETTCRGNRECLLNWYAHRRNQLLRDIAR